VEEGGPDGWQWRGGGLLCRCVMPVTDPFSICSIYNLVSRCVCRQDLPALFISGTQLRLPPHHAGSSGTNEKMSAMCAGG
jgi:hypothetical protein